jgi:hypothetical protein
MEPTARAAKQQKHKTEAVRSFSMLCFVWDLFQKYETKNVASSFWFCISLGLEGVAIGPWK